MEINLSEEVINTVCSSLRDSKHHLKHQLELISIKKVNPNRKEIIEHQLEEVEDALAVFEELLDSLY